MRVDLTLNEFIEHKMRSCSMECVSYKGEPEEAVGAMD